MNEDVKHTIEAIMSATWDNDPFPHLVIDDFLPRDLYVCYLRAKVRLDAHFKHHSSHETSPRYAIGLISAKELFNDDPDLLRLEEFFFDRTLTVFLLNACKADFEGKKIIKQLAPIQRNFEFITDFGSFELPPHTDTANKLVTLLIYGADQGADPRLGTSLFKPREEKINSVKKSNTRHLFEEFECVKTVPYRANTCLIFPTTKKSFHGVLPVPSNERRSLIQANINLDENLYYKRIKEHAFVDKPASTE